MFIISTTVITEIWNIWQYHVQVDMQDERANAFLFSLIFKWEQPKKLWLV